ncbi:MAG TPA: ribosome maturation factor RimM [Saprospiraceae bacterium]|nr:ribosome maturation factor RimM [Saprospiraceae bacterium]
MSNSNPYFKEIQYFAIGSLGKTHGVHGSIKCFVQEEFNDLIQANQWLFIKPKGNFIPFKILDVKGDGELMIQLEGIHNLEQAKDLAHQEIYVDKSKFSKELLDLIDKQYSEAEFEGFQLFDQNGISFGTILSIEEFPSQWMLKIADHKIEFYVPFVEEWLLDIDEDQRTVTMQLPDGMHPSGASDLDEE